VIIIGGGIAGLCAGVYAQKCGFDATVLESHRIAGGNCTSWRRGGYLFEGGMHWLTGSGKNEALNKMWRYVGALDDSVVIHTDEPFIVYDYKGAPIRVFRDIDVMEKHLLDLSPADSKEIAKLCNNVRKVRNLGIPVSDLRGVKTTKKNHMPVSMLGSAVSALSLMTSFSKTSRQEYISRFTHEGIRNLLESCTDDKTGVVPLFFTLGILSRGDGGFPEGGSLPFVERIVETFTSLGGELLTGTKADRVVIRDGKAVGVITGDITLDADAVIVTADTMQIDHLFETPPKAPWLDEMRAVTEPTMGTLVSLGIDADLRKYQKGLVFKLAEPISLDKQTYKYLSVNNYAADPVYSPEGKSALTVQLSGNTYDYWKKAKEEDRYGDEKLRIAGDVIRALEVLLPETAGKVDVVDVATPLTYERYCGNWKGSWMTDMVPSMKMKSYPAVIDGLSGLYFAGHRMMPPGGLPVALMSGRTAVQYLCRDTGTVFQSEG